MISLRNAVWQVSDFGLEAVNEDGERYRIPRNALLEIDQESVAPVYRCYVVVARAPDADLEGFLNVWPEAVQTHVGPNGINRRVLQDSIKEARSIAERVRQARRNCAEMAWVDLPEPVPAWSYPETAPRSNPSLDAPDHPSQEAPDPPIDKRLD